MIDKRHETIILNEILKPRKNTKNFADIINGFNKKLEEMDFKNRAIKISDYFGEGSGKYTAKDKLISNGIVKKDWFKYGDDDFPGMYVFIHDKKPFYFGIAKGVIQRILQHVKGINHNQATLAYNIAQIYYREQNGQEYNGTREKFEFKKYVEPIKDFLMEQYISFINIDDSDELYLFEVYCSLKYQTILNSFETH